MKKAVVLHKKCDNCGECKYICENNCIEDGQYYPVISDECKGCGACVKGCGRSAVVLKEMSGEASNCSCIDINDYRAVLAVSKAKNWSDAAFDTFQSASSVSKRISKVESSLGIRLFDRGTKSVQTEFSPVGESVMPYISNIVDTYDQIFLLSERIKKATSDELRVGYITLVGTAGETEIISAFRLRYPEIDIKQMIRSRDSLIQMVSEGELDCAFVFLIGGSADDSEFSKNIYNLGLSYFPVFFQDKKYIGLSDNHPMAKYPEVNLTELQNEIFIFNRIYKEGNSLLGIFKYIIPDEDGGNIRKVKQMDFMNRQLVFDYVSSGNGILPIATRPPVNDAEGVAFVPIARLRSPVFTMLVYDNNTPNLNVRKFIEFSGKYAKEAGLI